MQAKQPAKSLLLTGSALLLLAAYAMTSADTFSNFQQNPQIAISTGLKGVTRQDIARVRREAEKALALIPPFLGIEYTKIIEIEIVAAGICRTTPEDHFILLPLWHIRNRKAVVIHEVSHVVAARHEDNSFFSEGLAVFLQDRFGGDSDGLTHYQEPPNLSLDALIVKYRHRLIPLKSLSLGNEVFAENGAPEQRKLAYLEAGSFIKYLYETYGVWRLRELYDSRTLNYDRVYGRSIQELEADWRNHVFMVHAAETTGASD